MRASTWVGVLLAAALGSAVWAAEPAGPEMPTYAPMVFPEGEPGELERGLLDAFFAICSRNNAGPCAGNQKADFDREAAEASSDPSKVEAFSQRWRRFAALGAQRFHQLLQQPLSNPEATTINAERAPDHSITKLGMVTAEEDNLTNYVGLRKSPARQREIRDKLKEGNDALAALSLPGGATVVARIISSRVGRDISADEVKPYVLGEVQKARKKTDEGVMAYLALPEVQKALGSSTPAPQGPTVEQPLDADTLARLQREAENDEKCKAIEDPVAKRACAAEVFDRLRQAAIAERPPVVVPPGGPNRRPPTGLQPPGPQGIPTDEGLRFDVPPPTHIGPAPSSASGLLWEKVKPYVPAVVGAIAGAVLGAMFLAPFLGIGMLFGALLGAAALGVAGYFVGQKMFGGSSEQQ